MRVMATSTRATVCVTQLQRQLSVLALPGGCPCHFSTIPSTLQQSLLLQLLHLLDFLLMLLSLS